MLTKQKIKKCIIILTIMILISLSLLFYSSLNLIIVNCFFDRFRIVSRSDNMLVHFIDVGQADAVAINFPDGIIMLIDSGSQGSSSDYINYIKENVTNSNRDNYIDYLVLTHADEDHIGGALKLVKEFQVGTIFMPNMESDTDVYLTLLQHVKSNCNFEVNRLDRCLRGEEYEIRFFAPVDSSDINNSSQVIKVSCFDKKFLFTADISSLVATEYQDLYADDLDCDVLKVSHHGGKDNTSKEFLEFVTPDYAIISVGKDNKYGHPNSEVLTLLNNQNVEVLRTDQDGDVLFAVGNIYGMKQINGEYHISDLKLNYVSVVLFCDLGLIVLGVVIVTKKER